MFSLNIRYYRLMNRMSMIELAGQAQVSANAIKKYEHGEMMPSSETLEALASALKTSPLQLMQTWTTAVAIEPMRYRGRKNRTGRDEEALQSAIGIALRKYVTVLSLFPPSRFPLPEPVGTRPATSEKQIDEAASWVRSRLGVPATCPMPDLVAMLENRGYLVVMIPRAPDWFDAQYGTVNDRPYIALADGRPPDRQRHSIAHELGHLCLDIQGLDEEKAASRFAGALLLPEADMLRELQHRRQGGIAIEELRLLQTEYRVSMKSIVKRAQQLGIIRPDVETALYKRLNQLGLAQDEHADIPFEKPTAYRQMVIQLAMEQEISLSRGAELLEIGIVEMRTLLYGGDQAS